MATIASESDTDSGIAEQFAEAVRIVASLSSATDTYPTATEPYPTASSGTENAAKETEDAVEKSSEIVRLVKTALVEANGRAGASQVHLTKCVCQLVLESQLPHKIVNLL